MNTEKIKNAIEDVGRKTDVVVEGFAAFHNFEKWQVWVGIVILILLIVLIVNGIC